MSTAPRLASLALGLADAESIPRRSIVFVGGGSLGHLTPSLAVYEACRKQDPSFSAVFVFSGRADEFEHLQAARVRSFPIAAPKFPRGFSLRLLSFPFGFFAAGLRAMCFLRRERPALVFSKGGFVSVPFCLAATMLGIPIVLHSSDSVPSMSDRLIGRMAKAICTGFAPKEFPSGLQERCIHTGNPVRSFITEGRREAGMRITGFSGKRPVLMVLGGSQGAKSLNELIELNFDALIALADIVHLTGEGKDIGRKHARYFARPSVLEELPHLYALADLVVTRAGAGVLSELAVLEKAALVVPLEGVAHDHQLKNAEALREAGAAEVLRQQESQKFFTLARSLLQDRAWRAMLAERLKAFFPLGAAKRVAEVLVDN